jgi:hypothetical protein
MSIIEIIVSVGAAGIFGFVAIYRVNKSEKTPSPLILEDVILKSTT